LCVPQGRDSAERGVRAAEANFGVGTQAVSIAQHGRRTSDPDVRDRLYELLEHDPHPHSLGSNFVRLIVAVIVLDDQHSHLNSKPGTWLSNMDFHLPGHAALIAVYIPKRVAVDRYFMRAFEQGEYCSSES